MKQIECRGFQFDGFDWSLNRLVERTGLHTQWRQLFALKCALCRRFSLGCSEHWFCGCCEPCKQTAEAPEADDAVDSSDQVRESRPRA